MPLSAPATTEPSGSAAGHEAVWPSCELSHPPSGSTDRVPLPHPTCQQQSCTNVATANLDVFMRDTLRTIGSATGPCDERRGSASEPAKAWNDRAMPG